VATVKVTVKNITGRKTIGSASVELEDASHWPLYTNGAVQPEGDLPNGDYMLEESNGRPHYYTIWKNDAGKYQTTPITNMAL
jgi:hypothetical protein